MRMNRSDFVIIIILTCILCFLIGWCVHTSFANTDTDNYTTAMILQADNTMVIGKLDSYAIANGNMYKIKMNNKTYLVPYTRLTLISD